MANSVRGKGFHCVHDGTDVLVLAWRRSGVKTITAQQIFKSADFLTFLNDFYAIPLDLDKVVFQSLARDMEDYATLRSEVDNIDVALFKSTYSDWGKIMRNAGLARLANRMYAESEITLTKYTGLLQGMYNKEVITDKDLRKWLRLLNNDGFISLEERRDIRKLILA